MTGSLHLAYFGLIALLGSNMAAPATTSTFGKITRPAAASSTKSATPSSSSTPVAARKLSFTTPIVYDLDNVPIGYPTITTKSGVKFDASVYIIDMAGHSAAQIKSYKEKGKFVICYFSAGPLEPFRSDSNSFDPVCACGPGGKLDSKNKCVGGSGKTKMDDWDEYWLDLHSETCKANVKTVQAKRIKEAAAKGCDGVDPDNVDSYANSTPYGTTQADQIDYLIWLSQTVHAESTVITLKNSPDIIQSKRGAEIVKAFDLSVIESCAQYNECDAYSPFLAAKKPQIQVEYSNSIKSCPKLKAGQTLAVYSGLTLDSKAITLYCPGPNA